MNLWNRYGFVVFNHSGPEPADLFDLPDGNVFGPSAASVLLVPGETYSTYLAINDISINSNVVDLVYDKTHTVALAAVGTLTDIETSPTTKNFTLSFGLPGNSTLIDGYYRLRISLIAGGPIYSNRLWLNKSSYQAISTLFSYRNTRPIGPIAYDLASMDDFRNVLRLKCYADLPKTDTSVEEYERITTGVKVMVEAHAHQYVAFHTPNTDPIGREGWRTLLLHKELLINGFPYSLKTGYSEGEGNSMLATGSFEVWESAYSIVNRC
ncbi:hypothetical protein [Spirosoma foliorum]|uniref:Uncharacterized protein n=1 Tax=Spirosoma foliorum TaxID=2710596 RepID=A0A7G5H5H8_9BACT|nr:hypothetical protein [Spirosoma foliorum]QMW06370.1 hypothetical protein H3H32_16505 [Spirosoma foliorum]